MGDFGVRMESQLTRLDLGCGIRKRKGALGIDIIENNVVDIVHDLNIYPWPLADNSFDDVLMDNSLEHLDSVVRTMEEIHRIAKNGALITIKVPYFRSHYAIDPTHKQYFVSHSFSYFDPNHIWSKHYRYSDVQFKVKKIRFDERIRYSKLNMLFFSLSRRIANRKPFFYEEYLGHLFPMKEISFYLEAIKER